MKRVHRLFVALAGIVPGLIAHTHATAAEYTATVLGTLPYNSDSLNELAMSRTNDWISWTATGGALTIQQIGGSALTDSMPGYTLCPAAVSTSGEVVGTAMNTSGTVTPFIAQGSSVQLLNPASIQTGATQGFGMGVSSNGAVVCGWVGLIGNTHAWVYENGKFTLLGNGTAEAGNVAASEAYGVNNNGTVVGSSAPFYAAAVWLPGSYGTPTVLEPGYSGTATGVTESGLVLGNYFNENVQNPYTYFLWQNGSYSSIGLPSNAAGDAIDDAGDVLASNFFSEPDGPDYTLSLWNSGVETPITFDASLMIQDFNYGSLSDDGDIVASINSNEAVLLTPTAVPEPTAAALLVISTATLLRRRTRRQ